eukprot:Gb_25686 [translate_table: standard]
MQKRMASCKLVKKQPHILVFPFPAQGHIIPFCDLTNHLAAEGLSITFITTPKNAPRLQPFFDQAATSGLHVRPLILPFPSAPAGLPLGCESMDDLSPHLFPVFTYSLRLLAEALEEWINLQRMHSTPPVCLISDLLLGWTNQTCVRLGIPRVVFYTGGAFAVSVGHSLWTNLPHKGADTDEKAFLVSDLPVPVFLRKTQVFPGVLMHRESSADPVPEFLRRNDQLNMESWGMLINTFYELEGIYVDHLQRLSGRSVWPIGPVFQKSVIERSKQSSIEESVCLQWLDAQKPESVLYVCFGSQAYLSGAQIREVAWGLEASEQPFIWVIREPPNIEVMGDYGVLPEGFQERVKGKGLVINGWAPQLLILSHPSVGGFLSHCGWNSTLESINVGVPVLAWPMFAEQHINAVLLIEHLRIGVKLCEGKTVPDREHIKITVERFLAKEGNEMKRAKQLMKSARGTLTVGGSSYQNLEFFVDEMHKLGQAVGNVQTVNHDFCSDLDEA